MQNRRKIANHACMNEHFFLKFHMARSHIKMQRSGIEALLNRTTPAPRFRVAASRLRNAVHDALANFHNALNTASGASLVMLCPASRIVSARALRSAASAPCAAFGGVIMSY